MPKCAGCTGLGCQCFLDPGANITITGEGSSEDPFVINAAGGGGDCVQKNVYTVATVGPSGFGFYLGTSEPFLSCADFIGDGINDEVAINAAVAAAIGSLAFPLVYPEIYLNSGVFVISDSVNCLTVPMRGSGLSFIVNDTAATGFPLVVDPIFFSYINPGNLLGPNNEALIAVNTANYTPKLDHCELSSAGIGGAGGIIDINAMTTSFTMEHCDITNITGGAVVPGVFLPATLGRVVLKDNRWVGASIDMTNQFGFGSQIIGNLMNGNSGTAPVGNRGLINIINSSVNDVFGFQINDNILEGSPGHGIVIDGGAGGGSYGRSQIHDNIILNYGLTGATAFDGIFLAGNADENDIQGNLCRTGFAGARHGINISAATCDDNFVTNNNLFQSGGGASFNDAGTGTITVAGNRL